MLLNLIDLSRAHHLQELCWYDYLVLGIRLTVQLKCPEWRILWVPTLKVNTSLNLQLALCNLDAKNVVFFFEVCDCNIRRAKNVELLNIGKYLGKVTEKSPFFKSFYLKVENRPRGLT